MPAEALFLLGLERAPCHATDYDVFEALDVDAVEQMLGGWVREQGPIDHWALDGKCLRGSAPGGHDGRRGMHLVSAFASRLGGVVGQWRGSSDGNAITAALALLKGLLLADTVVTGDTVFGAGFPPPEFTRALRRAPTPPDPAPPPDLRTTRTIEKGHGRIETHTLSASDECAAHLG